ncbi:MAG: hypothetical protein C0501_20150 [Isosphaera sp.]|nr:hypothetical protein [Isosphaera sp.]
MLLRVVAGCGVGLLAAAGSAVGQVPRAELPPLLTPPPVDARPTARPAAAGPVGEYDHGHLYLPDYRPVGKPSEPRGLLARWLQSRRTAAAGWRPGWVRPGAPE